MNINPPMITSEYLAELRRLADAATPGQWDTNGCDIFTDDRYLIDDEGGLFYKQDAAFIVASRTAIPALLDHIEKLEAMMPKWVNGDTPKEDGYYFIESNEYFHGDAFANGSWQHLTPGEIVLRYSPIPSPLEEVK